MSLYKEEQGENVYVSATKYPLENEAIYTIYKININTNETLQITDFGVNSHKLINDKLYYVKSIDNNLYSSKLDGRSETKLSDNSMSEYEHWYDEVNGEVYYITLNEGGTKNLYKVESDKQDSLLVKNNIDRVEIINGKVVVKLVNGGNYGMKIFDSNGNLELTITDEVSDFFAHKDNLMVILQKDNSVKLVK